MLNLKEALLRHELRPKVVHRLPGRLRLRIAALRRLREKDLDVTEYLGECLALPDGIDSVSVDARTGSILLCYRPDELLDTDILAYVNSLLDLMVTHRRRMMSLHRADWKRIGPQLKQIITDATNKRLELQHIEIPEDVWP
jgi:hypothetical protein